MIHDIWIFIKQNCSQVRASHFRHDAEKRNKGNKRERKKKIQKNPRDNNSTSDYSGKWADLTLKKKEKKRKRGAMHAMDNLFFGLHEAVSKSENTSVGFPNQPSQSG